MITSRRVFLGSVGAATMIAAAQTVAQGVLSCPSRSTSPKSDPPGDADLLVRLNYNENAYGPSRKVLDAIQSSLGNVNRYPLMGYESLIAQIADRHSVKPEQVLVGTGSTDVLRMGAFAFLGSGKQLIQASPTFEAMEAYGRAASSEVISVKLIPRSFYDLDGMLSRVTPSTTLVYICNPNNPTATLTPRKDLEGFIEKLPVSTYVVIDEAYHPYPGQSGTYSSFIDHPIDDKRVIVTRTFSLVYGLAGLRLGYAVGSPGAIHKMRQFATEVGISRVAVHAASVALDDLDGLNEAVRRNANDRQEFFNQAMARALKPIDSHANFVMMDTFHPAEEVIQHFRKYNVLIGRSFPALNTHIRISLGLPDEMQLFWQAWDLLPYPKHTMQH